MDGDELFICKAFRSGNELLMGRDLCDGRDGDAFGFLRLRGLGNGMRLLAGLIEIRQRLEPCAVCTKAELRHLGDAAFEGFHAELAVLQAYPDGRFAADRSYLIAHAGGIHTLHELLLKGALLVFGV